MHVYHHNIILDLFVSDSAVTIGSCRVSEVCTHRTQEVYSPYSTSYILCIYSNSLNTYTYIRQFLQTTSTLQGGLVAYNTVLVSFTVVK